MSNEFKFETYNGDTDNPNRKYGTLRWESEGVDGNLFARTFLDKDGEEVIHVMADGIQETSPRELCVAIAKISGFKVRFEDELHQVKPVERSTIEIQDAINETVAKLAEVEEPKLWTDVRYRTARAAEVTPELVDFLYAGVVPELRELKPWYSETNGQPGGVTYYDPMILDDVKVGMGVYVVLRQGQVPQILDRAKFEDIYEEAV